MIELYHNDMSTCSQKARLALAEKGLDWTGRELALRDGDQLRPAYLAFNPNGVVPTLVHDGAVIVESTVINEYLDAAFPDPPLRPRRPAALARMLLWTKQLDEGLHAHTGVLSGSLAFRHQYLKKPPEELEAHLDRIPDPARRARSRQNIELGIDAPAFPATIRRFDKLLADMEAALESGPWLAGADYSLADIAYTPYAARLEHLRLDRMWESRPRVAGWFERVKARPSYESAVDGWLNEAYLPLMREKGEEAWPRLAAMLAG